MDDEVGLPKATIVKLLRECLPPETRVASESTELVLRCCTEFVQLVSAQANSNKQATIQPQHVIDALEQLEFTELSADIANHWREFQAGTASRGRNKKTRAEQMGLSEEDQIAMQAALFAKAANATQAPPV